MTEFPDIACACDRCVRMCMEFPCRPFPEDVVRMPVEVRARLSIQHTGHGLDHVPHLQSGARGYEGDVGPFFGRGTCQVHAHRCTFLTEAGRCELHGKCQPWEGRKALHSDTDARANLLTDQIRDAWNTELGRRVLRDWVDERLTSIRVEVEKKLR